MLNREQPQKNKQHLSPVFIYLLEKKKEKEGNARFRFSSRGRWVAPSTLLSRWANIVYQYIQ